jgi:hypothetical protein
MNSCQGGDWTMTGLMLRPDLKTAGGEVCDIVLHNEFVGTLTLVYRESDRLSGSIQLEEHSLSESDKRKTIAFLQNYVQQMVSALQVKTCEVFVTYSPYELLIVTDEHDTLEAGPDWEEEVSRYADFDPEENEHELGYELVTVSEKRNAIEYHIYDPDMELAAEADIHIVGTDVTGKVEWKSYPLDEEMEQAAELIVADFNEDEIDSYFLTMTFDGQVIEIFDLLHNDLYETEIDVSVPLAEGKADHNFYTIVLARDDDDALTYEIYKQSDGSLPLGTATMDISQRQITGFIDFREPESSDDRELIATLLLEELDKEKDFESVNLTMLHQNQLIDEILFETEQLH